MDELMRIKLEMSELGWDVEEKISDTGWKDSVGYSIWFKRSDWHGKSSYSITGKAVVFHEHAKDVHDYCAVINTVKAAAERAKRAWRDFPDSIPYQTVSGDVRIDDVMFRPYEGGGDIESVNKAREEVALD